MNGLDTNVLVRYLVQDEPEQARRATRYIRQVSAAEALLINSIVLCELVWVLESAYGFKKDIIVSVLDQIFMTTQFEIEERDAARAALNDYMSSRADFADCMIGRRNQALGCIETATFDRSLKGVSGFRML